MGDFSLPPKSISGVISGDQLAEKLRPLIGTHFPLTDKPRTNGSTLRKIVTKLLDDGSISFADKGDFKVIPLKKKGIPKLLAYLADTYIVTTGENYNLQVWNRFPNSSNVLIKYKNDDSILCKDIRFIFVQIKPTEKIINSIVVATPQYIVKKFGVFGVPTMKYQLIISDLKRAAITRSNSKCLFYDDTDKMSFHTTSQINCISESISDTPVSGKILSLNVIKQRTLGSLLGTKLDNSDTKTRGQMLERIVANLLGYKTNDTLVGGYPDIPNQLLEIKVQDSPTVDLGKYSPSNPIEINDKLDLSTEDVRYLIALTNENGIIEGVVLCPGNKLGEMFSFVSDTSYKCQRSIPMSFFDSHSGESVFNP